MTTTLTTPTRGPLVKLGRYTTPTGERWLVARRVNGSVSIVDTPAPQTTGTPYLVESGLHSRAELLGIVGDYLRESRAHHVPAMASTTTAVALDHLVDVILA